MDFLICEILFCLFVVVFLGGVIGWWLKCFFVEGEFCCEIGIWCFCFDWVEQEVIFVQGKFGEVCLCIKVFENDFVGKDDEFVVVLMVKNDVQ